ncbi:Alpha/Beta hydrolase protein [Mycena floridula]|nr:Alpha/Beta hydrolase protein [Mycena floridula]
MRAQSISRLPQPVSKVLTSNDGTKIHADAVGDPLKPAMVFIHGCSLGSILFEGIFTDPKWLDALYLVRYDVRGHGRSTISDPETDEWHSSKNFARDFDIVVEAFRLARPFIAGWSLGAVNFADIFACHPPEYVSGIISIAGLPHMDPSVLQLVTSPETPPLLAMLVDPADTTEFQQSSATFIDFCSTLLPYTLRQASIGLVMSQPRTVLAKLMTRTQDPSRLLQYGQDGSLPLLVICGTLDKFANISELRAFYRGWKRFWFEEMLETDHVPWISQPVKFRETVFGWVKEVLATSPVTDSL